jgi:hypothetical protein
MARRDSRSALRNPFPLCRLVARATPRPAERDEGAVLAPAALSRDSAVLSRQSSVPAGIAGASRRADSPPIPRIARASRRSRVAHCGRVMGLSMPLACVRRGGPACRTGGPSSTAPFRCDCTAKFAEALYSVSFCEARSAMAAPNALTPFGLTCQARLVLRMRMPFGVRACLAQSRSDSVPAPPGRVQSACANPL